MEEVGGLELDFTEEGIPTLIVTNKTQGWRKGGREGEVGWRGGGGGGCCICRLTEEGINTLL